MLFIWGASLSSLALPVVSSQNGTRYIETPDDLGILIGWFFSNWNAIDAWGVVGVMTLVPATGLVIAAYMMVRSVLAHWVGLLVSVGILVLAGFYGILHVSARLSLYQAVYVVFMSVHSDALWVSFRL